MGRHSEGWLKRLFRKQKKITCVWCGHDGALTQINAYEYERHTPMWVCLNTLECNARYWEKSK